MHPLGTQVKIKSHTGHWLHGLTGKVIGYYYKDTYRIKLDDREEVVLIDQDAVTLAHNTLPEPININELKRLLIEVVGDLADNCWNSPITFIRGNDRNEWKQRMAYKIENAILDGDDS